ncbi:MAG: glycosyltransferase family 4 protein [Burkholderiaceae bacterium]|nr:glycosyltransferase family 4 protein [Burkholderiaceae bacterium]
MKIENIIKNNESLSSAGIDSSNSDRYSMEDNFPVHENWYLKRYPDIAETGQSARSHFFKHGLAEGRNPNPFFLTHWFTYKYARHQSNFDLVNFYFEKYQEDLEIHPLIDLAFIKEHYKVDGNVLDFMINNIDELDFTNKWFSRKYYLENNQDLRGIDELETHFLVHGWKDGRRPSKTLKVITLEEFRINCYAADDLIDEYIWENTKFCVINSELNQEIISQIEEQSVFDVTILAPGYKCLTNLPRFVADNIKKRDLFDFQSLLNSLDTKVDCIFTIGRLGIGGGEKYLSNLAGIIARTRNKNCVIFTTESTNSENEAALQLVNLKEIRNLKIISLRDYLERTWKKETIFSLLVMALKPEKLFVVNSDLGLSSIKKHGKALSNITEIYVLFFSEAPKAMGSPYSAIYLRDVIPYAKILSDNHFALSQFKEKFSPLYADKYICIPPQTSGCTSNDFHSNLNYRLANRSQKNPIKALWVSRWDHFKATEILYKIANLRDDIEINVFGPDQPHFDPLRPANMLNKGVAWNINSIDFTEYDVFIFTSWFEGLPNVCLEMALSGIPIVASDVGGIRDTFSDNEIELVDMSKSHDDIAQDFCQKIDKITQLTIEETKQRLIAARKKVEDRHGKKAFIESISRIFD